eukprot:2369161-Rhodomonas_salina.2
MHAPASRPTKFRLPWMPTASTPLLRGSEHLPLARIASPFPGRFEPSAAHERDNKEFACEGRENVAFDV